MAKPDDQKIAAFLKAGLAGDQQAYRQFFHEIVPILKATVRSIAYMQNAEELEDIVQEVLTTLHNKRQSWKTDKPVLPWIYAITRHKTIDALRRYQRQEGQATHVDIQSLADFLPDREYDHNLAIDLEAGLNQLGTRLETVVRAIGLEAKNPTQTGKDLGMSENAVRIAFHRGLKKLRLFLTSETAGSMNHV